MNVEDIVSLIDNSSNYNLHSHTEYCDGHAPMSEMAEAAFNSGMKVWGITPHSPICIESPCNMSFNDVSAFISQAEKLAERYQGRMTVLTGMEVDFINKEFGPHLDYFQNLPLHYRIGSVHFVTDRKGIPHDCDGNCERFQKFLHDYYRDDLQYVVEKYFEQVLEMLELGGFEILGHFDKIAGNACSVDPQLESYHWYESLIDDVISHVQSKPVIVEINTKALATRQRFYPHYKWWPKLISSKLPVAFNSDAHDPHLVNAGREEALQIKSRLTLIPD